jgi:hypothetical protein
MWGFFLWTEEASIILVVLEGKLVRRYELFILQFQGKHKVWRFWHKLLVIFLKSKRGHVGIFLCTFGSNVVKKELLVLEYVDLRVHLYAHWNFSYAIHHAKLIVLRINLILPFRWFQFRIRVAFILQTILVERWGRLIILVLNH